MAKAKKKPDPEEIDEENGGLTLEERQNRDMEMFRGYLRGLLPSTLAMTYGLGERRVREIIKRQRESIRPLTTQRAEDVLQDYLLALDAMIDELAAVSAGLTGGARVSAIGQRLAAMKEKRDVLQGVGVLPADLGQMQAQLTAMQAARAILEVLDKNDTDEAVMDQILEVIEGPATIEGDAVDVTDDG